MACACCFFQLFVVHHVGTIPDMVTMEEYPTTGGNDVANKQIMITGGPLSMFINQRLSVSDKVMPIPSFHHTSYKQCHYITQKVLTKAPIL